MRKVGRPKLNEREVRNRRIEVRIDPIGYSIIETLAERDGISISEETRRLLMQSKFGMLYRIGTGNN